MRTPNLQGPTALIFFSSFLTGYANAFWRMRCDSLTGVARIDPLISKGTPSDHVHALFGSGAFGMDVTNDDLRNADCTSCAATQDKSAYWTPALYFEDATTGELEYVGIKGNGGMLAYYLLNHAGTPTEIQAFPKGFRMVAGDSMRRNYTAGDGNCLDPDPEKSSWAALGQTDQRTLAQRALGFNCLNYQGQAQAALVTHCLPDKSYIDTCNDGLRFEVMFPMCWNGVDIDSANHMDHVAYPDLVNDGNCPEDFPIRLPGLMYETIWDTKSFAGRDGRFVLSNGDTTGMGYHGDFMEGWQDGVLEQAVATCLSESGNVEDCAAFTIQDLAAMQVCKVTIPDILASENATGSGLLELPGNVHIVEDGEVLTAMGIPGNDVPTAAEILPEETGGVSVAAAGAADLTVAGVAETSETPIPESYPAPNIQAVSPSTSSTETTPTQPATTVAPEPVDEEISYQIVSTEYTTVGTLVQEIVWKQPVVYVTEDFTSTQTVTVGESRLRWSKRNHGYNHQAFHPHY